MFALSQFIYVHASFNPTFDTCDVPYHLRNCVRGHSPIATAHPLAFERDEAETTSEYSPVTHDRCPALP